MDELENMEVPGTGLEETQEAQEAAVTNEPAADGETDPQEPEAPQEAAVSQETGTQEEPQEKPTEPQEEPAAENTQPEDDREEPQEPAQEAQEAPVTNEPAADGETDPQEPEAPQEAAVSQETKAQEEPQAAPALGGERLTLGSVKAPALTATEPGPTLLGAGNDEAEDQETDEEYETLMVNELDIVKLGRQGEHLTQQVVIDCTAWLTKLPECDLMIAAIRPGEKEIYLPIVTAADGVITWDIQDQDTAKGGWGRGEVRAMLDGKIKKSAVFRTRIEPSLEGSGAAPVTPPDWVQEILGSVAAAQAAAEEAAARAIEAAENTRGLAGWILTKENDGTVTIDYEESEG